MEKIWLKSYPPGMPTEVDTSQYRSLVQLLEEVRGNTAIRNAPLWSDFGNKMRDGVLGRAGQEMSSIAAQFRIKPERSELERRTAEMISSQPALVTMPLGFLVLIVVSLLTRRREPGAVEPVRTA